jgi:DNA replicative helicase MCM subunit Mcm2 (Cdc46/Mcm family)
MQRTRTCCFARDNCVQYNLRCPHPCQLVCIKVRPGDRIEVTGVFRAVPHRANPHMRTVKSIYKTYLDVVHFRRADQGEDRGSAEDVAGIDRTVERPAGK